MEEKYIIKVKDTEFTLPKKNLRYFAIMQALEKGLSMPIENDTQAKEVLSSVGIKVVG